MKIAITWILITILFVLIICNIVLKFMNPDMTSTRFFITYWPLELVMFSIGFIVYVLTRD